jgi:hypothetical protein
VAASAAARIAAAAVVAAAGLVLALLDPARWFSMIGLFLAAGGLYLVLAAPVPLPSDPDSSGRRPIPFFGPPASAYSAGWGGLLILSGLLFLLEVFQPGLGFIVLYIWLAALVILFFVVAQVQGVRPHEH